MSTVTTIPTITLPDQFNAATVFLDRHLTEGRGAKTAIYHEGATYSYAQLTELANRIGNGLLDLGVEMEQRVALILFDSPQFAACFFWRDQNRGGSSSAQYDDAPCRLCLPAQRQPGEGARHPCCSVEWRSAGASTTQVSAPCRGGWPGAGRRA